MTTSDKTGPSSASGPRDGTPRVHGTAQLRNATLGRFCELKERVQFCDSILGDYSYVERHSEIIYATIGKFCAIAADVRINALRHPMERISQHKMTYRPNEYFPHAKLDKPFRESRIAARVNIGHDVWIGHGAIVLPGVTIGHGAVIAAGSVVTKDVAPHTVAGGVPAGLIKRRFAEDISTRIIALAWWDWDHERLGQAVDDMRKLSVEDFLSKYEPGP